MYMYIYVYIYAYPMQGVEEYIDRLGGAKFTTMLDLAPLDPLWLHPLQWESKGKRKEA